MKVSSNVCFVAVAIVIRHTIHRSACITRTCPRYSHLLPLQQTSSISCHSTLSAFYPSQFIIQGKHLPAADRSSTGKLTLKRQTHKPGVSLLGRFLPLPANHDEASSDRGPGAARQETRRVPTHASCRPQEPRPEPYQPRPAHRAVRPEHESQGCADTAAQAARRVQQH